MKYLKSLKEGKSKSWLDIVNESCIDFIDSGFTIQVRDENGGKYRVFLSKDINRDSTKFCVRIPAVSIESNDVNVYIGDGENRCLPSAHYNTPGQDNYEYLGKYKNLVDMCIESCQKMIYTFGSSYITYGDITITKQTNELRISILLCDNIIQRGGYALSSLCY